MRKQKPRFATGTEVEGTSAEGKNIRGRVISTLGAMTFVDNSGTRYRCYADDLRAVETKKED